MAGNGGSYEELQEFLANTVFVLKPSEDAQKTADPMWAADTSSPADWFFSEE